MISIENEVLIASFNSIGAELCSLKLKANDLEYIWQAGDIWPKHSPILFPIVGTLKDGYYIYHDETYYLNRHGFAREAAFTIIEHRKEAIIFELESTEATKEY